jgi:hypothetical protein
MLSEPGRYGLRPVRIALKAPGRHAQGKHFGLRHGFIGSGPIGKNPRKFGRFRKPAPVFFAFVFNREFHGNPDICPDSTLAAFLMPRAREGTGQDPLRGIPNNHPHPIPRILNTPTPPPIMKPKEPSHLTLVPQLTDEAFKRLFEAAIDIRNRTDENELVNPRLAPFWNFCGTYTPDAPYFSLSVVRNPVVQIVGDQSCTPLRKAEGAPSNDPQSEK